MVAVIIGIAVLLFLIVVFAGAKTKAPPKEEESRAPEPAKPAPMRVMHMHTVGLVRITDDQGERVESLPDSPLGHGEYPEGLTVSDAGNVYVVGKLYTGRPGPDDGVVWERSVDGDWKIAFTLEGRIFRGVIAFADGTVCVGTKGGFVRFDGERWAVHPLPVETAFEVFRDDDGVFAYSWDAKHWFSIDGAVATPCEPRARPEADLREARREGTTYRVFDRSTEIGEKTLSDEESEEIRSELAELERALKDGRAQIPKG